MKQLAILILAILTIISGFALLFNNYKDFSYTDNITVNEYVENKNVIRVLCIGDSNTHSYAYVTDSNNYCSNIQGAVGDMFVYSVNAGKRGDDINETIDRIDDFKMEVYVTNYTTIMLGINDFINGDSVDQAYVEYLTLIDKLESKGFKVIIISYFDSLDESINDKIRELNERLRLLTVPYINLNSRITVPSYYADDYHLNNFGHMIIAELIRERLQGY